MDYNTRQSGTTTTTEIWRYSGTDWTSLKGFDVEATDGKIGSVDEQSDLTGASYIVVDTGPWIFGKKVLLPAGTIQRIEDRKSTRLNSSHANSSYAVFC